MYSFPDRLASYKYDEPVSYSKFSLGIHYADSSSVGVVSPPPPAETSADVASSCFDRTGSAQAILHMQALWQRQFWKGCSRQQGGTRYSCEIWSGGTNYSAVDSPGGPLSRGDCPQCDRLTSFDDPCKCCEMAPLFWNVMHCLWCQSISVTKLEMMTWAGDLGYLHAPWLEFHKYPSIIPLKWAIVMPLTRVGVNSQSVWRVGAMSVTNKVVMNFLKG